MSIEMKVPESVFTNGTDVRKGVPGVFYRNHSPLSGRKAFDRNRKRTEDLARRCKC